MNILLTPILHVLIVSIVLLIYRFSINNIRNYFYVFCFSLLYIIYSISHYFLQQVFNFKLSFSSSGLNWTGKIFSSIIILLFIFIYGKKVIPFSKFRIEKGLIWIVLLVFLLKNFLILIFIPRISLVPENLFFQMLVALNEEVFFRSILIGVTLHFITKKERIWLILLPSTILFGLGHSLFINDLELSFSLSRFLDSFIMGYFWGWLILKSRSLFYPVLSHFLDNIMMWF